MLSLLVQRRLRLSLTTPRRAFTESTLFKLSRINRAVNAAPTPIGHKKTYTQKAAAHSTDKSYPTCLIEDD
jgi:hypothetical protein